MNVTWVVLNVLRDFRFIFMLSDWFNFQKYSSPTACMMGLGLLF
jgi:hypothetical protein